MSPAAGSAPEAAPAGPPGRALHRLAAAVLWRHVVHRRVAYALLGSAVIFTLSSLPLRLPGGIPFLDKWAHLLAYAVLGLAYQNVATRGWRFAEPWRLALGWAALALYGLTDEAHQAFVPGRSSDVADWLADLAGGAIALLLSWAVGRALRRGTPSGE